MNRLIKLISKLIFSSITGHWTRAFIRNFRDHHDSGGSLYTAQCLFLSLYLVAHYELPEHNDALIELRVPTPWSKLRLGYAVCDNKQPDCSPGCYLWFERTRQSVVTPTTFSEEIPF